MMENNFKKPFDEINLPSDPNVYMYRVPIKVSKYVWGMGIVSMLHRISVCLYPI